MKISLVILFILCLSSCGSNPKIVTKNTVFDNSLDRETVIQMSVDYLQKNGLSTEYKSEFEDIIEYDEYWSIIYQRNPLSASSSTITRLVLKINKQSKEVTEEHIK